MRHFILSSALLLVSAAPLFAQDASPGETPFERLDRMISEQPCGEVIPRLDEEYARGGMPGIEDRDAFTEALKERVAEYGTTWGLLIGWDENGRLSEEAHGLVRQLRSLCAEDPDATLGHLMDFLE